MLTQLTTDHAQMERKYWKAKEKLTIVKKQAQDEFETRYEAAKENWLKREESLKKEIEVFKECLSEGKGVWEQKYQEVAHQMKDQELEYQKVEAKYQKRLIAIDNDLDEIIFSHKRRLMPGIDQHKPSDGDLNILPGLFSEAELEEERRIALGEQSNREANHDFRVNRLEQSDGRDEKWDIQLESESEADITPEGISPTSRDLLNKLRDLRGKVKKYKTEEYNTSDDKMPSYGSCENLLSIQSASDKSLLIDTINKSGIHDANIDTKEFSKMLSDKMSEDQREAFIYDLLNEEEQATGMDAEV